MAKKAQKRVDPIAHAQATAPGTVVDSAKEFPIEKLPSKDREFAVQSMREALRLQGEVNKASGKIGELVFSIVKKGVEAHANDLAMAVAYVTALLKSAEVFAVKSHKDQTGEDATLSAIIPLWAQYKSAHMRTLSKGISPFAKEEEKFGGHSKYGRASEYAAAGRDTKAERAARQGSNQKAPDTKAVVAIGIASGLNPELSGAMANLYVVLRKLDATGQIAAAGLVMTFTKKVEALVPDSVPTKAEKADDATPATGEASAKQA